MGSDWSPMRFSWRKLLAYARIILCSRRAPGGGGSAELRFNVPIRLLCGGYKIIKPLDTPDLFTKILHAMGVKTKEEFPLTLSCQWPHTISLFLPALFGPPVECGLCHQHWNQHIQIQQIFTGNTNQIITEWNRCFIYGGVRIGIESVHNKYLYKANNISDSDTKLT